MENFHSVNSTPSQPHKIPTLKRFEEWHISSIYSIPATSACLKLGIGVLSMAIIIGRWANTREWVKTGVLLCLPIYLAGEQLLGLWKNNTKHQDTLPKNINEISVAMFWMYLIASQYNMRVDANHGRFECFSVRKFLILGRKYTLPPPSYRKPPD